MSVNMGLWALFATIFLNFTVSIDLLMKKNYAMSLVFACYGFANLGLCIIAYKEKIG